MSRRRRFSLFLKHACKMMEIINGLREGKKVPKVVSHHCKRRTPKPIFSAFGLVSKVADFITFI